MSSYKKNLISVGSLSLLNVIFSFLLSVVISREYGPEGRGFIYLPVTLITLFLPILTLGTKQSLSYFISSEKLSHGLAKKYLIKFFIPSMIAFCFIFSTFFAFTNIEYDSYFFIIFLIVVTRVITDVYSYNHILKRKNFIINLIVSIRCVLDFIFIFIAIYYNQGEGWILLSYAISSLIAMVFQIKISSRIEFYSSNQIELKKTEVLLKGVQFALPLFLIGLNVSFDLVILKYFKGLSEVGIYQTSVTIANLLWILPSIIASVSFSFALDLKANNNEFNKLIKKTFIIIIMSLPVALVLFILSDSIFVFVYGNDFFKSSAIFKILLPGYFIMLIYKVMYPFVAAKGNTYSAMLIFLLCFIINVTLNIILTPRFGSVGTAYSTLISYTICGILFIFISYKAINND
ncbi:hypothetical protein OC5_03110 [Vibrio cyclitrophicus ZF264]|uniref:oligosaccharide flippase family protein n=1 Tax=Vibrio cyclitrophicus TaxID=47951 RepID=UPI0002F66E1E|nr:oligosaccharide flippase family protein [Vibrio cyclitrophicus]OEE04356.1 hypothetical protein OC5_03110 [Vibrio cyclitrophicus ZF264]